MIKIYIANESKQKYGGGWTFLYNLMKGLKDKVEFIDNWKECDIYFIAGATMISRDEVALAAEAKKKIVLRVDNIPRNSRNRNTGTSRLYDFAQMADTVIYQSQWAKNYVGYFIQKDGPIIYNGVDQSIFKPDGSKLPRSQAPVYLFAQFNRDENKNYNKAFYYYHHKWRKFKATELWLLGQFSKDIMEYKFDFFMGEPVKYLGVRDWPEGVAQVLRSVDFFIYSYQLDACSNQLLEAIASGCKIIYLDKTGGAPEIKNLMDISLERMADEYLKEFEKLMAG